MQYKGVQRIEGGTGQPLEKLSVDVQSFAELKGYTKQNHSLMASNIAFKGEVYSSIRLPKQFLFLTYQIIKI